MQTGTINIGYDMNSAVNISSQFPLVLFPFLIIILI